MADRPILFSAPMVQALLVGTKTQTRRIIKPQPIGTPWFWEGDEVDPTPGWFDGYERGREPCGAATDEVNTPIKVQSAGDRLWVKETWRTESRTYDDLAPSAMGGEETILYDADADWKANKTLGKSRVSIHMTRWASRITLVVKDVRVERLKDISRADAMAEGIIQYGRFYGLPDTDWDDAELTAEDAYSRLWDRINGDGAADLNPWAVAYTFSVIKQNIDQIGRAAA